MKNEQFSKSARNFVRKIIPSELFIELSIEYQNTIKKSKKNNILNNDEPEDEGVLKKFNDKKRRKILNKLQKNKPFKL